MKKNHMLMVCGIIIIFVTTIIIIYLANTGSMDAAAMEYRVDRDPIISRFDDMPNFSECYWKADAIGTTNFGPTNYWMRGFAVLEYEELKEILKNYKWTSKSITFPDGIDPNITEKSEFNWCVNKEFETMILKQNFVGNIYVDINNGVIYFDVENS